MASELPQVAFPGAAEQAGLPSSPDRLDDGALERARGLVAQLLDLVADARDHALELERERDWLRGELEEATLALAAAPAAPRMPGNPARPEELHRPRAGQPETERHAGGEPHAPAGDLRRALSSKLGTPPRRRAPLMALLGGDEA